MYACINEQGITTRSLFTILVAVLAARAGKRIERNETKDGIITLRDDICGWAEIEIRDEGFRCHPRAQSADTKRGTPPCTRRHRLNLTHDRFVSALLNKHLFGGGGARAWQGEETVNAPARERERERPFLSFLSQVTCRERGARYSATSVFRVYFKLRYLQHYRLSILTRAHGELSPLPPCPQHRPLRLERETRDSQCCHGRLDTGGVKSSLQDISAYNGGRKECKSMQKKQGNLMKLICAAA